MGGLVEAASGVVDRRLLTTTFLPVLLFLGALGAVGAAGAGWSEAAGWWSGLGVQVQVTLTGLVLAFALLLSRLIAVQRVGLIRIYEGYWDALPYGRRLAERCRLRFAATEDASTPGDHRSHLYPADESRLMPTALGNILRGAEDHSRDRYAIDGVTAWPRLYPTLPESFQQTFASAAGDLDLMITVSGLGLAFSLLGGALAAALLPWYGALLCCWAGLLIAWWGYRGAVRAAEPYGELFRAAFDVYRWTLLDTMGLRRPAEYHAEAEQWRQLDKLWIVGAVDSEHVASLGFPGSEQDVRTKAASASPPDEDHDPPSPAETHAAPEAGGRRVRPLRLAPWLVAAAVTLGIVMAGGSLAVRSFTSPSGWKAVHALRPFQVLTAADVSGPSAAAVAGRYTLRHVAEGAPVDPAVLGPRLPYGVTDGKAVVTLRPRNGRLFADGGARGTMATLRLVPPSAERGRPATPLIFTDVMVLDLLGGTVPTGLVIAVPAWRLQELLSHAGDSDVYLVTAMR
ncbi:hypothetical protein AB0K60_04630 [Thermopolyspora sp. NPDC052614]|uniref:hypothetical protein n=1 Tax=Thermopolyspora sp. NPDC052614 TaxID=3155682 RepID=UPI00343335A7